MAKRESKQAKQRVRREDADEILELKGAGVSDYKICCTLGYSAAALTTFLEKWPEVAKRSAPNVPEDARTGPISSAIVDHFADGRVFTRKDVLAFCPDQAPQSVSRAIQRMVARGHVRKVNYSLYMLANAAPVANSA